MKTIIRWAINTLIFPYTFIVCNYRINKLNDEDKAIGLAFFTEDDHWFKRFWFGRVIKNLWIYKVSKIEL